MLTLTIKPIASLTDIFYLKTIITTERHGKSKRSIQPNYNIQQEQISAFGDIHVLYATSTPEVHRFLPTVQIVWLLEEKWWKEECYGQFVGSGHQVVPYWLRGFSSMPWLVQFRWR